MSGRRTALAGQRTPRRAETASRLATTPCGQLSRSGKLVSVVATSFPPFWALLRNREPVADFDAAGVVHTVMVATELMPIYEYIDSKLALNTARVLGPCLPRRHVNQGAPQ